MIKKCFAIFALAAVLVLCSCAKKPANVSSDAAQQESQFSEVETSSVIETVSEEASSKKNETSSKKQNNSSKKNETSSKKSGKKKSKKKGNKRKNKKSKKKGKGGK